MHQGVRLRHVRLSPKDARVNDVGAPKYRTDARACRPANTTGHTVRRWPWCWLRTRST